MSGKRRKMTEDEREQRILDQIKSSGRVPTAPPGKFHSPTVTRHEAVTMTTCCKLP